MKALCALFFLTLYSVGWGQAGMTVLAGTTCVAKTGTIWSIDSLVLTPSTDFTLNVPNNLFRYTTVSHPLVSPYIKRVFLWGTTTVPFQGSVAIYYATSDLNGLTQNQLYLYNNNGTLWTEYTSGITRGGAVNYVSTSGLNLNMQELTLSVNTVPLSEKWLTISAFRENGQVLVRWTTKDEDHISGYRVNRSIDGVNWVTLPDVITPTKYALNNYTRIDASPPSGIAFYRVESLYNTLNSQYSEVVEVNGTSNSGLSVSPNPFIETVDVREMGTSPIVGLALTSVQGQTVWEKRQLQGVKQYQINVGHLSPGLYFLQVHFADGTSLTRKLTK